MAFDFIFMLTADDRTIPKARERLADVLAGGARHIGFKDVGLPFDELKALSADIRAAGPAASANDVIMPLTRASGMPDDIKCASRLTINLESM